MGKHYLNREEKLAVFKLTAFYNYLGELIAKLEKHKPNKTQLKHLRTARTFLSKAGGYFLKDLDLLEHEKLIGAVNPAGQLVRQGEFHKMELVVKHKDEALREYKEALRSEAYTPVECNDFNMIYGLAAASCTVCPSEGNDVIECPFRQIFHKYDLPIQNEDAPPGVCPYKLVDKGGMTD